MEIAGEAATELARLKETGRWKISASDSSDDFSTKHMPAPVKVVVQKVAEKAGDLKEDLAPPSPGTLESAASVASASASSLSAQASSSVVGKEPGIAQQAIENVKAAASVASDSAIKIAYKGAPEGSSSISSATSSVASSLSTSPASSTAPKKVWGGAMAEEVEVRQIIFEDYVDTDDDYPNVDGEYLDPDEVNFVNIDGDELDTDNATL